MIPPDYPVVFQRLNASFVQECANRGSLARLGVRYLGTLSNAVEIKYAYNPEAGSRWPRDPTFRVARTIQETICVKERESWQTASISPAGTEDNPDPDSMSACLKPPLLFSYDNPGWFPYPEGYVGELSFSRGDPDRPRAQTTTKDVSGIEVKQNFIEWIELLEPEGGWRRVSKELEWYNRISLARASPRSGWHHTNRSNIGPDHPTDNKMSCE